MYLFIYDDHRPKRCWSLDAAPQLFPFPVPENYRWEAIAESDTVIEYVQLSQDDFVEDANGKWVLRECYFPRN
jgi:hypothetical protein